MEATKGEWKAVFGHDQMCHEDTTVCQNNYCESPNGYWMVVSSADNHGSEKATAKLIAAAPDLLEALIECAPFVTNHEDGSLKKFQDLYQKAIQAIKKATELEKANS